MPASTAIKHSPTRSATMPGEDRALLRRLLCDLVIFIVLILPLIMCEFVIEPVRRGFFCGDNSIQYPFRDNTVTPVLLGILVGALPIVYMCTVEFVRFYRRGRMGENVVIFGWKTPTWLVQSAKEISWFTIGMILTLNATEIGKYTVGRLRPHFMATCQPQFPDGTTCADPRNLNRYVEDYVCLMNGFDALYVRQARLSFPSGHASMSFYAMVYLAIYTQHKLKWQGSKLWRHFLQFVFVMWAWFTALSRVMDHWHHWSDVLAGSAIGIVFALLTAKYVNKHFKSIQPSESGTIGLTIPRQDTTATLQEVMSTTPPPYTNQQLQSFSSKEHYAEKV